jgi:hypothetical protein
MQTKSMLSGLLFSTFGNNGNRSIAVPFRCERGKPILCLLIWIHHFWRLAGMKAELEQQQGKADNDCAQQ